MCECVCECVCVCVCVCCFAYARVCFIHLFLSHSLSPYLSLSSSLLSLSLSLSIYTCIIYISICIFVSLSPNLPSLLPLPLISISSILLPLRPDEAARIQAARGWITEEKELYMARLHRMDLSHPVVRDKAQQVLHCHCHAL